MTQANMQRIGWLAVMVALAMVGACGDDSDGGSSDGGGDEMPVCFTELDEDTSGVQAVDYLCDADPSADPDAANACRNESDCAIINTDEVRELARVCGLSSRGMEADCDVYNEFNQTCVVDETSKKIMAPGLSMACAACYADTVACGTVFCLAECAGDADLPECVDCQLKAGCRLPFERCSGLERE